MTTKQCQCRGAVCHGANVPLRLVHLPSRVGGRGTHVLLSEECETRFAQQGTRFTVVGKEAHPA